MIYAHDKKNMMDDIKKASKNTPGVGSYDTVSYDEKRLKLTKGYFSVK
jgi:hypothetical protein